MKTIYVRFKELYAKYGPAGLIFRILIKPYRILRDKWRKKFNNYHYIFRLEPNAPRVPIPEGFTMEHFERIEDIPVSLLEQLNDKFGIEEIRYNLKGVKYRGCVFCVGLIHNKPVCIQLFRYASYIPNWFIELDPDDVVLLRGFVAPEHRGKRLHSCMHQAIASLLYLQKMSIYTDISIHNAPSLNSVEKSGFKRLCKKKAITERWPAEL